jgi:hypothetical protein
VGINLPSQHVLQIAHLHRMGLPIASRAELANPSAFVVNQTPALYHVGVQQGTSSLTQQQPFIEVHQMSTPLGGFRDNWQILSALQGSSLGSGVPLAADPLMPHHYGMMHGRVTSLAEGRLFQDDDVVLRAQVHQVRAQTILERRRQAANQAFIIDPALFQSQPPHFY